MNLPANLYWPPVVLQACSDSSNASSRECSLPSMVRRCLIVLQSCVIAVLLSSLVQQVHGQEAAFSTRDTGRGFSGSPSTIQSIFWLDEDRILYSGYEPNVRQIRKRDGKSVAKLGVYILDLRSNNLTRHADLEGFLCYRDGFIRYFASRDPESKTRIWREGKLGEEKEVVLDGNSKT